jgi:hypothetical protein
MSGEFLVNTFERFQYFEKFGNWKWLKLPALGVGGSEIGAIVTQTDWAHVFPLIGLGITAIGTAGIGLYRYWRLTNIEIADRQREADARYAKFLATNAASFPIVTSMPPSISAPVPAPISNPVIAPNSEAKP